jgi:hypothetical protein
MSHHGPENSHAMNGSQRYSGETNGAMRDQPQPHVHSHLAPQPHVQPSMPPYAQPQVQSNTLDEIPEFLQSPVREPRKAEARDEAAAPSEGDPVRRRRKRYTANGSGRGAASVADGASADGKQIEVSSEDRSSDEALI